MSDKQMIEKLAAEESMFVQTAQGITIDETTLTLKEVTPVTLFIDPFGRPLSPISVCGMRRRERRRMRRRI